MTENYNIFPPAQADNIIVYSAFSEYQRAAMAGYFVLTGCTASRTSASEVAVASGTYSKGGIKTDYAGGSITSIGAAAAGKQRVDLFYIDCADDTLKTLTGSEQTPSLSTNFLENALPLPPDMTDEDWVIIALARVTEDGITDTAFGTYAAGSVANIRFSGTMAVDGSTITISNGVISLNDTAYPNNITQADGKYIATDKIIARDSGGLCLYEDGGKGAFVQDSTGFFGIGTTTPAAQLEIVPADATAGILINKDDWDTEANRARILFNDASWQIGAGEVNGRDALYLMYAGNVSGQYFIVMDDDEIERFVIDHAGNVGIGTTAPDKILEVNTGASDNGIRISYNDSDGSATNYCDYLVGADGDLTITTVDSDGAAGHINFSPDGNVGVKTATPSNGDFEVTGDGYFSGDVSALTFTDRTPIFLEEALPVIKNIKDDGNGEIDHASLPEFVRKTHIKNIYEKIEQEKIIETVVPILDEHGAQILDEETSEPLTEIKQETIFETVYNVIGEEEEQQRDIGAMVSVLTKGIQELIDKNISQDKIINNLQTEINNLATRVAVLEGTEIVEKV